jgi:hypothetical protein
MAPFWWPFCGPWGKRSFLRKFPRGKVVWLSISNNFPPAKFPEKSTVSKVSQNTAENGNFLFFILYKINERFY